MEDGRYVLKIEIIDTESEETIAHGSIEVPNQVRGNYEGLAVEGPDEWTEDAAEGVFWDTMRDFRRAQADLEADEASITEEEETI